MQKHVALLKSNARQSGGLEKYASRIADAFAQQGAKVSILTTGDPSSQMASPLQFYATQTCAWPAFRRMEQFDAFVQNWLSQNPADLIFGMDRNRFQTHIRAGNGVHLAFLKSRILAEGHLKYRLCLCNPLHRKILSLEKTAFEYPGLKKLFANSFMVRDQLLSYYNIDPNKIEVIHNGVEWQEMENPFQNTANIRNSLLERFQLNQDVFQFLFIGNGYLRKGLSPLLQALSRIKTKEFQLSVIGKDNHIDFFKAKTAQLGLANKVRFFGPQETTLPFYQMADALIIPSFYDPFANVTLEALAMGLSVISSKYNGGHEILTSDNGIIVEDLLQIDALADILEKSLMRPKTKERSHKIRNSVMHLDFSKQLNRLIHACG